MVPLNLPVPLQRLLASRGSRRATLTTFLAGAIVVVGASIAFACIPWTGKLELENLDDGSSHPEENGTVVYGADHSDEGESDDAEDLTGDTGNGQGMVWCSTEDGDDDLLDDQHAAQPYQWAEVSTSGDSSPDIRLIVDDNNNDDSNADNGNSNNVTADPSTESCDSDLYLPEDNYTIDFEEDSFDNADDSREDGEPTYADNLGPNNHGSSDNDTDGSNDDSNEVGGVAGESGHCMDLDTSSNVTWNLAEDENGNAGSDDEGDSQTTVDEYRFTSSNDTANGQNRDVVDEGPHSIEVDLDQFGPDPSKSGDDTDGDGHTDAAGVCITSTETFMHDNNDTDDDDSEVDNDETHSNDKDDKEINYGNAIPVNILPTM